MTDDGDVVTEMGNRARDLMDRALQQLGESPEAWRGAAVVAYQIREVMGAAMGELNDDDWEASLKVFTAMTSMIAGQIAAVINHPAVRAVVVSKTRVQVPY